MAKAVTERRKHKRTRTRCPFTLFDSRGHIIGAGDTVDVSDGGALLSIPEAYDLEPKTKLEVAIFVPRKPRRADNLDLHASAAQVARHRVTKRGRKTGLAIQFSKPVSFSFET